MQYNNGVRQVFTHANDAFGSNVVTQSPPLKVHPCNTLIYDYVGSCLNDKRPDTTLYVTSDQQLSDIPKVSINQLQSAQGHSFQVKCHVQQKACAGSRYVLNHDEEPWLAKQGPDRFDVQVQVLKPASTRSSVQLAADLRLPTLCVHRWFHSPRPLRRLLVYLTTNFGNVLSHNLCPTTLSLPSPGIPSKMLT